MEIALDQTGLPNERKLALVDKNRDLYLTNVRKFGKSNIPGKLGVMVQSLAWSQDSNMLAAMQVKKEIYIFISVKILNQILLYQIKLGH